MAGIFYPIIRSGDRRKPLVYLTFDDGPDPTCTHQLLDILKSENTPAAFFLVGSRVDKYPEIARRIVTEGHLVGNHSYNHHRMLFKSKNILETEILRANQSIENHTGQTPHFFRPPYGRFGITLLRLCKKHHLRLVLWDLMPHDYKCSVSPELIIRRITRRIKNGRIIVLHDSRKLVPVLPAIISRLKKQGFRFSTLDSIE